MIAWRGLPNFASIGLPVALASAVLACLPLSVERHEPVFTYIAIVDITRSMNVLDYGRTDRPVSRLEFVRQTLRQTVAELPCGSKFGLGVFTERSSSLLFEPIETCEGYHVLAAALAELDWRMAWAADSRISAGLSATLETLARYADARLLFISDGQEAPPVNPRYPAGLERLRGRMKGLLVGAGGLTPMPIPKYDESGRSLGFVASDEVPHRSTFGLSELPPEEIEGYHARNAPFGNAPVVATEHLSALREDYLQRLAAETGLVYHRLESEWGLLKAMTAPQFAASKEVSVDIRWIPAVVALAGLAFSYWGNHWYSKLGSRR